MELERGARTARVTLWFRRSCKSEKMVCTVVPVMVRDTEVGEVALTGNGNHVMTLHFTSWYLSGLDDLTHNLHDMQESREIYMRSSNTNYIPTTWYQT